MSTHNICFRPEKKNVFVKMLLTGEIDLNRNL